MTINKIDNLNKDLARTLNTYIMDIRRGKISNEILSGIPIAYNNDFVIINVLLGDYRLDGFSIIRVNDITQYRIHEDKEDFIMKVQSVMNLYPCVTFIPNLLSMNEIFCSLSSRVSLISIEKYSSRERIAWIGKIKKTLTAAVWISEITEDASFTDKPHIHYFKSISKISFNDNYMKVLWEVYTKSNMRYKDSSKAPIKAGGESGENSSCGAITHPTA